MIGMLRRNPPLLPAAIFPIVIITTRSVPFLIKKVNEIYSHTYTYTHTQCHSHMHITHAHKKHTEMLKLKYFSSSKLFMKNLLCALRRQTQFLHTDMPPGLPCGL